MKDMLANLPQYQEQREKVFTQRLVITFIAQFAPPVLSSSEYGAGLHEHL
jgi:hypothetical protein